MTYRDLLNAIEALEDEQLDQPAYARVDDEFCKIVKLKTSDKSGNLEENHPFIVVN